MCQWIIYNYCLHTRWTSKDVNPRVVFFPRGLLWHHNKITNTRLINSFRVLCFSFHSLLKTNVRFNIIFQVIIIYINVDNTASLVRFTIQAVKDIQMVKVSTVRKNHPFIWYVTGRDLLKRDVVEWRGMGLIRHVWLNVVVVKADITLLRTVEATFGVTMVENLTIGAQLVLCSTKNEEAANIFTTLVSHAEQNHGRLG